MTKQRLFIDFDDTIVNTIKTYVDVYNFIFESHTDYKYADWKDVSEWNYTKTCPLAKDNVNQIFESQMFFDKVHVFDNAIEELRLLSESYDIIIVTIGTQKNISNKSRWIEQNLPFIKNAIYLYNGSNNDTNKSIIDMSGGIFIDDHQNNLYSSNADIKVCFTNNYREYKWNKDWDGLRVGSWKEVSDLLL